MLPAYGAVPLPSKRCPCQSSAVSAHQMLQLPWGVLPLLCLPPVLRVNAAVARRVMHTLRRTRNLPHPPLAAPRRMRWSCTYGPLARWRARAALDTPTQQVLYSPNKCCTCPGKCCPCPLSAVPATCSVYTPQRTHTHLIRLRQHHNRRGARVDTALSLGGGNALHAVHARFMAQPAECSAARDRGARELEAACLSAGLLQQLQRGGRGSALGILTQIGVVVGNPSTGLLQQLQCGGGRGVCQIRKCGWKAGNLSAGLLQQLQRGRRGSV